VVSTPITAFFSAMTGSPISASPGAALQVGVNAAGIVLLDDD
jgi:hypothetical protein